MSGLIQGKMSGHAQSNARRAQEEEFNRAIAEQQRQYDLTRADYQPWVQAGTNALARLQDPNAFEASPDYAFRRSEGQRDIGNSFAARGGAFSGNALKALTQYNENLASGEYGNWWNRQAGLAGLGQGATNAMSSFGNQASGNISNLLVGKGDARASGIIGRDAAFWNRYDTQSNKALNFFGSIMGGGGFKSSFGG